MAMGLAVGWLGCRFGGPWANPDEYVAYPSDAGNAGNAGNDGDDGEDGGGSTSDSPGDDTTIGATADSSGDDDGAKPPVADAGRAPSTCPSTGCQFAPTPSRTSANMCGCGYNDGAICH
jgi:hypothetical protein